MAFAFFKSVSKAPAWAPFSKKPNNDWRANDEETSDDLTLPIDPLEDPGASQARSSRDTAGTTATDEQGDRFGRSSRRQEDGDNGYRYAGRDAVEDRADDVFELPEFSWSPRTSFIGKMLSGVSLQGFGVKLEVEPINFWIDWAGSNFFIGTDKKDIAYGLDGHDYIELRGGDDTAYGGAGNDFVHGGLGDDRLFGNSGNDVLAGDKGDDQLDGGSGNDTLLGHDGDDRIWGQDGADTLKGDDGDDRLDGGAGDDQIEGGNGRDFIWGREGSDVILGGDGNDELLGGDDDDFLHGGAGNDHIYGGNGADTLAGDLGDDNMSGDAGDDIMVGQDGNDRLHGGHGDDDQNGGSGNDRLWGDAGDDKLLGESGDDLIWGGDGNDEISGGSGNDYIQGGSGNDEITGGTNGEGDVGDYMLGGSGYDFFFFKAGDSGGASSAIDVIEDFTIGGDLIVVEGFFASFLGQQSGFSDTPGAEAYFEHAQHEDFGDITYVHVRDDNGLESDLTFSLLGHQALTQNDIFII